MLFAWIFCARNKELNRHSKKACNFTNNKFRYMNYSEKLRPKQGIDAKIKKIEKECTHLTDTFEMDENGAWYCPICK